MITFEVYEAVRAFHLKNNLEVLHVNNVGSPEQTKLCRIRLILEELGETAIAIHKLDGCHVPSEKMPYLRDVADGLCDLLYVVMGTAVSMTHPIPDPWECFYGQDRSSSPLRSLGNLTEAVNQVVQFLTCHTTTISQPPLYGLILEIHAVARFTFKLPLRACFLEVHRSNMTKILGDTSHGKKGDTGNYKGQGFEPPDLLSILQDPANYTGGIATGPDEVV